MTVTRREDRGSEYLLDGKLSRKKRCLIEKEGKGEVKVPSKFTYGKRMAIFHGQKKTI